MTEAFVTPEDFGADGTPAGDTAAIQAAAETGQVIMFLPRVYLLADIAGSKHGIQLWGKGAQRWIGAGRGKTILRVSAPTAYDPIHINDNKPVHISDITFDAAGNLGIGSSRYKGFCALMFINNTQGRVEDCEFINFHTCGLNWNRAKNAIIRGNVLTRLGGSDPKVNQALHIYGEGDFCNVLIDGNLLDGSGMGIGGRHFKITRNSIRDWGFSAGINIQFNDHHLLVSENHIDGCGTKPSDQYGTDPCGIEQWASDSIITNNIIENCAGCAIGSGGQHCIISGNICRNNGQKTDGNNRAGILISYADEVHNGNHTYISNNACYDTQGTKTQQYGIKEVNRNSTGVMLIYNQLASNGIGAVQLQANSTVKVVS